MCQKCRSSLFLFLPLAVFLELPHGAWKYVTFFLTFFPKKESFFSAGKLSVVNFYTDSLSPLLSFLRKQFLVIARFPLLLPLLRSLFRFISSNPLSVHIFRFPRWKEKKVFAEKRGKKGKERIFLLLAEQIMEKDQSNFRKGKEEEGKRERKNPF